MPRPKEKEIDEVANWAVGQMDQGVSSVPGMTYEEGVDATIRWMRGETEDRPDAD